MVEGALQWYDQEQKDQVTQSEYLLDWASWFTANLMVATGNYGKHAKADKIKAGLFTSTAEREAEKRKDHKKKVADEQKALMDRFNLAPEDLVQAEN